MSVRSEIDTDVVGVRMQTAAAASLFIHLLALASVTGIVGISGSNTSRNYIAVELIQKARSFDQIRPQAIARSSVKQPDIITQPIERSERATEDSMSMTPRIDPPAASATQEANSFANGPASDAKADYLAVHRVSKLPFFKTQVAPVYPYSERSAGVEARVIAEVYINERGGVDDVKIVKSAGKSFDEAVLRAVKDSTFSPGYLEGLPVAVKVQIPFAFKLR